MSSCHFLKLDDIPIIINRYVPKPTSYNGAIYISTGSKEYDCTPGIYEYDLESNKINLIYKYGDNTNHSNVFKSQHNLTRLLLFRLI